jgi:peptide/nickel transport system ATP-binding protein/oligopeptide transport system ATP-binding protein
VRGGLLQRTVNHVRAVDDVSFTIFEGETLGLVGETGCGKTTIGRSMLRLIEPTSGSVCFEGREILHLSGREMKDVRREMQIIFQDPYASLDPRAPIGESVMEGLNIHGIGTPEQRFEIMLKVLHWVGLEEYHARRYPHEFSGGHVNALGSHVPG